MADLKENELAQKNDFNFVRGLDAAGNSILINKADLVKVVEELLSSKNRLVNFYSVNLSPRATVEVHELNGGLVRMYKPTGGHACLFMVVKGAKGVRMIDATGSGFFNGENPTIRIEKNSYTGNITIINNTDNDLSDYYIEVL